MLFKGLHPSAYKYWLICIYGAAKCQHSFWLMGLMHSEASWQTEHVERWDAKPVTQNVNYLYLIDIPELDWCNRQGTKINEAISSGVGTAAHTAFCRD